MVLRFSYVANWVQTLQMLIPNDVLFNDYLDLWINCYPTTEDLRREHSSAPVPWTRWNIEGERGDPPRRWPLLDII
jgi:hypothetical protein